MRFGFHPLTDLNSPKKMLRESVEAERSDFSELYYADHFHPWSSLAQGTSFAWTLIASAAERTRKVRIGTAVTCPMLRYNPAIVAQAFATLAATYEGRIFLGVGTGEALNEVPVGYKWPNGKERLEMLEESILIMRKLWTGEYATFEGKHYSIKEAKLFTIPSEPIPLYVSAFGPKAANIAGRMGDGWITGNLPDEYLKHVMIPSFENGIRSRETEGTISSPKSGRAEKIAELLMSYDEDYEKAVEACLPIAGTLSPAVFKNSIIDPREIKAQADSLDKKLIGERLIATDNFEKIIKAIEKFGRLGFDCVEIASLSPNNSRFLTLFKEKAMPVFYSGEHRN